MCGLRLPQVQKLTFVATIFLGGCEFIQPQMAKDTTFPKLHFFFRILEYYAMKF